MDTEKHIYPVRLDFLYQSIAAYAATLVVYLVIRSIADWDMFPTLWQDPILLLLSAITLLGVLALLYNLFMRRRIEIGHDSIQFMSRARKRTIVRADVASVQIGPRLRTVRRVRAIHIRLKSERRTVRIRLWNFQHRRQLLEDIRAWAGPLVIARVPRSSKA